MGSESERGGVGVGVGVEGVVHGVRVVATREVNAPGYQAVVVVTGGAALPHALEDFVVAAHELDATLTNNVGIVRCAGVSGGRLVLAPTGPITPYHDVRSVGEAMGRGVSRAVAAGAKDICICLTRTQWTHAPLVALLAAIEAVYVPLQIREGWSKKVPGVMSLGVYLEGLGDVNADALIRDAVALEIARGVARDVGGADPERMTPMKVAAYAREVLAGAGRVSVRVVEDPAELRAQYPLFAAVDRAAQQVPRHRGCIIWLEYEPENYSETVMLVGKGVTYDTGGCDVKVGGAMAGMSRDKCGAAAVLGFIQACALMRAPLKAVGALAMVRNSIGSEAYVADELLRTRTGKALRVGNTDAEGRMAMADLLAEMVERAPLEKSPHLYTVATLTGHAHRALGPYTACADNHVARAVRHAEKVSACGEAVGEPGEVSTLRREDLAAHAPRAPLDDIHQADSCPSTQLPRGHQGPGAFLMLASGLDAGSIPFTHLDVAGSAGSFPAPPTAAPLLALAHAHGLIAYRK